MPPEIQIPPQPSYPPSVPATPAPPPPVPNAQTLQPPPEVPLVPSSAQPVYAQPAPQPLPQQPPANGGFGQYVPPDPNLMGVPLDAQVSTGQVIQPQPGVVPDQQYAQTSPPPRQQLAAAASSAGDVLCQVQTIFPFTLFPDKVTIDREKLTVTHRSFFRTGEVTSINIEDILNVAVNLGPLIGSIKVTIRYVNQDQPLEVHYLSRKDALKVKDILQGYIIARQSGIDTSTQPTAELASMLQRLGGNKSAGTNP